MLFAGIVSRMNSATDDADSSSHTRLKQLAGFQVSILKHVLSFPSIKRVVYSTCSIHTEENEAVVEQALQDAGHRFALVDAMPNFPSRGSDDFACGPKCIRVSSEKDLTNGFFVACFERKFKEKDGKDENSSKEAGELNRDARAKDVNSARCSETVQCSLGGGKKKKRKVPLELSFSETVEQELDDLHCGKLTGKTKARNGSGGRPNTKQKQRKHRRKHKPVTS